MNRLLVNAVTSVYSHKTMKISNIFLWRDSFILFLIKSVNHAKKNNERKKKEHLESDSNFIKATILNKHFSQNLKSGQK